MAVMLSEGREGALLIGFNIVSKEILWENPIPDKHVDNPVLINNMILLTSSRIGGKQSGEPTLYAYDILTGAPLLEKEFPRDHKNQGMIFQVLEEYNSISVDNPTILLKFTKFGSKSDKYKELVLIEAKTGSILWTFKLEFSQGFGGPDLMTINSAGTELLVMNFENDILVLNHNDGSLLWQKNLSGQLNRTWFWNQKILQKNREDNYLALWDPITQKQVWKYDNKEKIKSVSMSEFNHRLGEDVLLQNTINGDLAAINFDGGFFNWKRERWTQHVGIAKKIWFKKNNYNRVFCLTEDDMLYTINLDNGQIINSIATDSYDYSVNYDNTQNAMVLNNDEFLIGIDPKNGDQLWKIRDKKISNIQLMGNSILAAKIALEDSIVIINTYNNKDNGETQAQRYFLSNKLDW